MSSEEEAEENIESDESTLILQASLSKLEIRNRHLTSQRKKRQGADATLREMYTDLLFRLHVNPMKQTTHVYTEEQKREKQNVNEDSDQLLKQCTTVETLLESEISFNKNTTAEYSKILLASKKKNQVYEVRNIAFYWYFYASDE